MTASGSGFRIAEPAARLLIVMSLSVAFLGPPASGQETLTPQTVGPVPVAQEENESSAQGASGTSHTVTVNGDPIPYRATAGLMPIRDKTDRVIADIFFVAYERLGPTSSLDAGRPITFAFNGGPGSSAVWLHMGGLGPRRAVLPRDGTTVPDADRLEDNEYAWLEFTDLVFVDPVGSGFSRAAPGVDAGQFFEVQEDVNVACEFVRLFVTEHERWLSPQFIAGESYGAARAVAMARRLQEHYGLYIEGLVLLSSALNMGTISFDPGNDLPYVLILPSYSAAARYHGRLGGKTPHAFERTLEKVETWALNEYIVSLAKGSLLSEAQLRQTAGRLAEYTGLPQEIIATSHLRIRNGDFIQDLLRAQNRTLGLLDSRVTVGNAWLRRHDWTDPSFFLVQGPFVAAFNGYVRTELGFRTDLAYIFLSERANQSWNWGGSEHSYLNVAPILAEAMNLDNRLRVFAAAGYCDLTTPYLSQEYVFNHLDLPTSLRKNITFRRYPSGHQIYTSTDALRQLTGDVRAFVAGLAAR
jgi:carboxypeptidase C (cathepsin A)